MNTPPPCHVHGQKLNTCAAAMAAWQITGNGPLGGDHWRGWRLAGRDLVSPDGQRINARRLLGILFRESGEERINRARARVRTAKMQSAEVMHIRRWKPLEKAGFPGGGVGLVGTDDVDGPQLHLALD